MFNMKLLSLTVGSLVLASTATADFGGFTFTENANAYGVTYQIFVELDAGDELNAVSGNDVDSLVIGSDSGFMQATMFGAHWNTINDVNEGAFGFVPSLEYDSWIGIGYAPQGTDMATSPGFDFSGFETGNNLETANCAWYLTPGMAQGYEVGGSVLIGQFTVAAGDHVYGTVNLQGRNADGSAWDAIGVSFDTIPAPGALALLGLAGLAARRRRK